MSQRTPLPSPHQSPSEGVFTSVVDIKEGLRGNNRGDNVRILIARAALMNLLYRDTRVGQHIQQWDYATGLGDMALRAVAALERFTRCVGLPGRWMFWTEAPVLNTPEQERNFREASEYYTALEMALRNCAEAGVVDDAVRLVRDELGLSWPWVASDLVQAYQDSLRAVVRGCRVDYTLGAEDPDPPAPSLTHQFQNNPGETLSALRRRLEQEARQIDRQLADIQHQYVLPRGHVPRDLEREMQEGTGRHVHWYYLHEVSAPPRSIRGLAKESHADLNTVRKGIKKAKKLLNLIHLL